MLTAERKRRGKKKPEGLTTVDEMKTLRQLSSHPVSCFFISSVFISSVGIT